MKKYAILGSTGSIGTQTLDIIRRNEDMEVVALSAGSNITLLEAQAREFQPEFVAVSEEARVADLRQRLADTGIRVLSGMEGLCQVATHPEADVTVTAIVGMIGIKPTLEAIRAGKDIALANKETLVCAGHLVMPLAEKKGVRILPVDSEHSAISQCLRGNNEKELHQILLTASGGPFLGRTAEELANVTAEQAIAHPNWSMGRKISVDSSTLVNKGLEVIEAMWLFNVSREQIHVLIHPQSMIHSMVQYRDGSIIAQLGPADMRLPIQYAISYEKRLENPGEYVDLTRLSGLTFLEPDYDTFRGIPLADEAIRAGGSMPAVFNLANEWAVEKYLQGEIPFPDIYRIIEACMSKHTVIPSPDEDIILQLEQDFDSWLEKDWVRG